MIDYDPHDWRSHLLDIKGSMLREILWRVMLAAVWGTAVTILYEVWQYGVEPKDRATIIPVSMHLVLGTALGLLLVFRTNASYDRFWEGRRMWGSIINESRNFVRLGSLALAQAPEARQRAFLWLVTFAYASMHHLRGTTTSLGPGSEALPDDEVREVLASGHPPLSVARKITAIVSQARDAGHLSDYLFVALDQNVQLLVDYLGACERIHKTPLPFAYVVHLRRVVLIYLYTLPLALIHDFGWSTILATLFVAYTLLGIEEIGVEIEDPFNDDDNDLPLERFCDTIRRNISMCAGDERFLHKPEAPAKETSPH